MQYTYDDLGQLTSADNNLNNAWDIGIGNTISYDANGNILDLTRGSTTKNYVYYAGTNKVQNTDGAGNDYGYDSNANITSSSPKSINTIAYDTFTQRPTSVSLSSGASLTMQYSGGTQRVLKNYTSGGNTNSKLYLHGQNDYPLIEKNKTSATAETLAVYIYGANGVIAKRMGSTVLFLLKDHLGSTRVVMDATGLVRSYYDYDALGNLIRTGTVNEVKYQFTGQEYDESGMHNYRARLYDSDLGKFYAVDPDGYGSSPYLYVGNDPISFIDPSGRFAVIPAIMTAIKIYSAVRTTYNVYQASQYGWQYGFAAAVQGGIALGVGYVAGGIGSQAVAATGYQVVGLAASSTINSVGEYALSGGRSSLSTNVGLGSINWSKGSLSFTNPFDGGGILTGASELSNLLDAYGDASNLINVFRQSAISEVEGIIGPGAGGLQKDCPTCDDESKYVPVGKAGGPIGDEEPGMLVTGNKNGKTYRLPDNRLAQYNQGKAGAIRNGGNHNGNLRVAGGYHLGNDHGVWRWHKDFYDGTTGLGAPAHWLLESGLDFRSIGINVPTIPTQHIFAVLRYMQWRGVR